MALGDRREIGWRAAYPDLHLSSEQRRWVLGHVETLEMVAASVAAAEESRRTELCTPQLLDVGFSCSGHTRGGPYTSERIRDAQKRSG